MTSQDPSVSKSNRFTCCDLSVVLYSIRVDSLNSPKMISISPEVLNFNGLFINATSSSVTSTTSFF